MRSLTDSADPRYGTVLLEVYQGGIGLSLHRLTSQFIIVVRDSDGVLHVVTFPFTTLDNPIAVQMHQDEASNLAREYFDSCSDCIADYVRNPTSQSIRTLVNQLH